MSADLRRQAQGEAGSATVELAVALPAVVLAVLAIVTVAVLGVTRIDVEDAARVATRQAALGESDGDVAATARQLAGDSAQVRIERSQDWVTVSVSRSVWGLSRMWPVSSRHTTRTEASLLGLDAGTLP